MGMARHASPHANPERESSMTDHYDPDALHIDQHWSKQGAEYDGTDCENCGRERVLRYDNGRRICEKCNWDQEFHGYATDHEIIG